MFEELDKLCNLGTCGRCVMFLLTSESSIPCLRSLGSRKPEAGGWFCQSLSVVWRQNWSSLK